MYSLNEEKMFYDVADDQAIIIDSSTGDYYALNVLASLVFDLLAQGASVDSVLNELKKILPDTEQVEEKLHTFINQLLSHDIIIKTDSSSDIVVSFEANIIAEGFAFDIEKFDDSQDILLADPIHDVDEEQGWPILKDDKK